MADTDHREEGRLAALLALNVLDTQAEPRFDRVTQLASSIFAAPIALVSLIDAQRQWFKSRHGLDACETARDVAFCSHAVELPGGSVMVIEDAARDPRFADNPLVIGPPHIRFYAGAVLTTGSGHNLGTLCVIDTKPRTDFGAEDRRRLQSLACIVTDELELANERRAAEEERRILELAELMSGVGHWRYEPASARVTWSEEMYRIYGVTSAFEPDLERLLSAHDESDRPAVEAYMRACVAGETDAELKVGINRPDGERRTVVTKSLCERNDLGGVEAVVGVVQDITEREAALQRVRRSEARYRLLADHMGDVVTRLRLNGASRYISPAVTPMLGYTPREMAGRAAQDFVHPDDQAELLEVLRKMRRGQDRCRLEHRAVRKDGSFLWVETDFQAVRDPGGEPIEIVAVIRDITERRRLDEALREARDKAEAASQAKSEFLANMSHELRTPLTSVIGFSSLLLASDQLVGRERRCADRINVAGKALLSVINDVLDFSRLEADAMALDVGVFSLSAMARDVADIILVQVEQRGLAFEVDLQPDTPDRLIGDEAKIKQIILNLLSNAAKFTEQGAVKFSISSVAVDPQTLRLMVSVSDTGIGISPQAREALFERFVQADGSTTRKYGGTGLGLAISKRLVELMGGEIGVDSEPGRGSRFWFNIILGVASD